MLGHQPAAGERSRQLGSLGGEAHVAHQRATRPIPAHAPLMAARIGLEIDSGKICGRRQGSLRVNVHLAVAERLQLLHIRTRTETPAGARSPRSHELLRLSALLGIAK